MYCENCGASVNVGAKFCSACGNKIEADESSGDRRQNSSYNVQTILLISIPALLLIIVGAWLIIPSTPQSTRRPEEQSAPKSDARAGPYLSPSDSDIKSLLEGEWNKGSFTVPLGNFDVIGGLLGSPNVDASKGAISTNTYKELLAWQKVGLVTVRHDQRYEKFRRGERFTLDQYAELTQKNVQTKIAVTPTDRGRQYRKSGSMDKLEVLWGKFRITHIVKNEKQQKGVDEYRLIMATYDAQLSPECKAFWEFMGHKIDEKRKVIVLLKFDSFESKWKQDAADYVNANEEFKTNNVARALASSH